MKYRFVVLTIISPLELMERLAALVPRPRVHLTRFHGVLAPHYKYRSEIVPKAKEQPPQVPTDKNKKPSGAGSRSYA
ncbi:MAG: transposase [Bdellovibrionaceae bacterium]|nr:transposase [Pseudobdellovibrionaceae bacterium]